MLSAYRVPGLVLCGRESRALPSLHRHSLVHAQEGGARTDHTPRYLGPENQWGGMRLWSKRQSGLRPEALYSL